MANLICQLPLSCLLIFAPVIRAFVCMQFWPEPQSCIIWNKREVGLCILPVHMHRPEISLQLDTNTNTGTNTNETEQGCQDQSCPIDSFNLTRPRPQSKCMSPTQTEISRVHVKHGGVIGGGAEVWFSDTGLHATRRTVSPPPTRLTVSKGHQTDRKCPRDTHWQCPRDTHKWPRVSTGHQLIVSSGHRPKNWTPPTLGLGLDSRHLCVSAQSRLDTKPHTRKSEI